MTKTTETMKEAAQKSLQNSIASQNTANQLNGYLRLDNVSGRLKELMGDRKEHFISNIMNIANSSQALLSCSPQSIVNAAIQAVALELPIDKNLGYAHIVPYGWKAQFQLGYKGFIQLALRTGAYQTMNVATIYEGQLVEYNILTGELIFNSEGKTSESVLGYVAFIRLTSGFEKTLYMTREQMEKHARQYSKSFSNPVGMWQKDFEKMAHKTVLKLLLSRYGILSIQMQQALKTDQAVINDDSGEDVTYIDAIDTTYSEEPNQAKTAPESANSEPEKPKSK